MHHCPIKILNHHLQRLIKAAVHQTPNMPNLTSKSINMLPAAPLRIPLPMLYLTSDGNAQLKGPSRILIRCRPVRLDHYGRRRADAAAEDLSRNPGAVGDGWVPGEDLHVAASHDGNDIENALASGPDVGLD